MTMPTPIAPNKAVRGIDDAIATRAADIASRPNNNGDAPVQVSSNVGTVASSATCRLTNGCGTPGIHGISVSTARTSCAHNGSQEDALNNDSATTLSANALAAS